MTMRPGMARIKLEALDYGEEQDKKKGFAKPKTTGKRVQFSPEITKARHRKLALYTYDHPTYSKMQDVVIDLIDRMEDILKDKEEEKVELGEKADRKQLALRLPQDQAEKLRRHRALTGESVPKVLAKLVDSLPDPE